MRNKALLNALLEAAVDAIVVVDDKGMILRANPAACTLFQYSQEDLVGDSVNKLMPADTAHAHDGYMKHHMDTGESHIIGVGRDVEGVRRDGKVFPLHLSVGRADVNGDTLFIGVLHDLSIRAATQDALARSQRLDALGKLTGGIAHDFNNILTVVIGNLELLENRGLSERQGPLVGDALASAELGAEMTERLKVFARRSDLRPVKADIAELCVNILAILHRSLGANYVIQTNFPKDLKPVMIDPVQFQSALMNLILNARDAMGDHGRVLLTADNVTVDDAYLAQETDMQSGDYVRLSISDDGAGMSEEARKRAFEPFFTTKEKRGGTGLGLAMVYGFVRQSGGHITLYSEPDMGTSFGLYFPVTDAEENQTTEYAKPDSPPHDAPEWPHGSGQTILVVEDNQKVRKLSVERLQALGYRTESASSGDEAWQRLTDGLRVDAVFTDLVMPGTLNGYDLADKIRQDFPGIPVLLTTGYASDVVTDTRADTRREILHKPYRQAELAARLQQLWTDLEDDETC